MLHQPTDLPTFRVLSNNGPLVYSPNEIVFLQQIPCMYIYIYNLKIIQVISSEHEIAFFLQLAATTKQHHDPPICWPFNLHTCQPSPTISQNFSCQDTGQAALSSPPNCWPWIS